MHRARPLLLLGAATLLLAACGTARGSAPPTWEPSPALGPLDGGGGPGAQASPILPVPTGPGGVPGGGSGVPGRSGSAASPTRRTHLDPLVVATHLEAPVGLALLPDGSALVGERTTGRIVRVQPRAGQPVPTVRVLSGLDTSGDGGLLDLALSPTYAEDGLIYAYVTTPADNRVVDFTLNGPVTPVFTGIPRGRTGNGGRLLFAADGNLYVATGDAGRSALTARPHSLAGKVLRLDDIGDPAKGNPAPSSPIWLSGSRRVVGLCAIPRTTTLLDVETGGGTTLDQIDLLTSGGHTTLAGLPAAYRSPGGCAVQGGRIWIPSLDGQALVSAALHPGSGPFALGAYKPVLKQRYGRLRTVVAAPDGALWLTTSNRDGHGRPVAADERVIRYLPTAGAGNSPL